MKIKNRNGVLYGVVKGVDQYAAVEVDESPAEILGFIEYLVKCVSFLKGVDDERQADRTYQ